MIYKATILLLFVLVLIGCEAPQEFQGLKWDVDISVPLMNRYYPIYDLEDGENFVVEDTLLTLFLGEDMESEGAGESLVIQPKTSRVQDLYPAVEEITVSLPIDETGITDEDIEVTYALIAKGWINIELKDVSEDLNELEIVFADIMTPNNEPLTTVINEFDETVFTENIAGCFIGDETNETVIDSLNFHVYADSEETFDVLGSIRIYIDRPLEFDHFQGYLKNKEVGIEDERIGSGINYPHNISNALELEKAVLEVSFINEMGFDGYLTGTLRAKNIKDNQEKTVILTKADNILFRRAEAFDRPSESVIEINKPEITQLLNVYPDSLIIENAKLIIGNDDGSPGFATSLQKSYGKIKLYTKSVFSINNSTIVPDTVYAVEISEKNREYIEEYPQEVLMSFIMENTLPVGAAVDIYFSSSPDTVDIFGHSDDEDIHNLAFTGSYVGSRVSSQEPGVYDVEFHLDRQDLELFLKEEIFFAIKITFDETDGPVAVRPDHYIRIIGNLNVKLRLDI